MTARLLVALALLLALPASAHAIAGDRDPEFNGGQPIIQPGTEPNYPSRSAEDAIADGVGRTIIGGLGAGGSSTLYDVEITRLLGNGTPDPSFGGGDGIVTDSTIQAASAPALALDGAGRLYAGITYTDTLLRLTDSGTRDQTFGQDGATTLPSGAGLLIDVFVDPDGTSTVLTVKKLTFTTYELRTYRFDDAGVLDATYAPAPIPYPGSVPANTFANPIAVRDSQRRIVVAGRAGDGGGFTSPFLMRLKADGTPDSTWNGASGARFFGLGTPTTKSASFFDLVVGPGDVLAVTGKPQNETRSYVGVTPDGATPTFTLISVTSTIYRALSFQPDGKLLAAGVPSPGQDQSVLQLHRFAPNPPTGIPFDPTFGPPGDNGQISDPFPTGPVFPQSVLRTPNGKIVVVGSVQLDDPNDDLDEPKSDAFISRYLGRNAGEGPPDPAQPPGLTGTPRPGEKLSCSPGTYGNGGGPPNQPIPRLWEYAPRAVASAQDPSWVTIPGSTGAADYTVRQEDLGQRIRCREVPVNAEGSASNPSRSLRVDTAAPAQVRGPAVTGVPVSGSRLTCDVGEWTNNPDFSVRWLLDGQPIQDADGRTFVPTQRGQTACEVTAVNDVGAAAAVRSAAVKVVEQAPRSIAPGPTITKTNVGGKATDLRLTCSPGQWIDDYEAYEYRWIREGAEIAGATGQTYDATAADLGRNVGCVVYSTNPAGRSDGVPSPTVLVPLPASGIPGAIYQAGGFNALDPVNLMAVSAEYKAAIKQLVVARRRATADALRTSCATGEFKNEPLPDFDKYVEPGPGYYLGSNKRLCPILLKDFNAVVINTSGAFWNHVNGRCKIPDVSTGGTTCPRLGLPVPPLNAAAPLSALSAAELGQLQAVRPVQVLWDFDSDGETDASCDPDAPILRSLYNRGYYRVRAVIVGANSEATGLYSVTDYDLRFFPQSTSQKGALRNGQPFACKTSLEPPPDPALPCVNEVTFGRAHVTGNLCPVSARRMPQAELEGLPRDVQKMLVDQSINGPLRRSVMLPSTFGDQRVGGLPALPTDVAAQTTSQISALSTLDGAKAAEIAKSWEAKLKDVKSFNLEKAQHAMDQIYIAKGSAYLNGVKMDAIGQAKTVLVPSDAGEAIEGIKKLTVSSTNLQTSLGGIPIGDPGKFTTDLQDKIKKQAAQAAEKEATALLKSANLDKLADSLKSKLNLGPFKLAGDAKVKLNNDGTAQIDAWAELPKLLTKPGSKPIRAGVQVNATRTGKLSLNGIHMTAPSAFLGAVHIADMALDYDGNGLSVKGKLLFPPVNAGVAINQFKLDNRGNFQALDVDYLAGSGQGIPLGYGLFMTKIGGGLSLNPDEIKARTAISVGPSSGGGCPTIGMEAQFTVHFAPDPFFVDATGNVGLVCIPLGSAHFYADSTGLVDLSAGVHIDIGPLYFSSNLHGRLQLPRWQIDYKGEGGIRHLLSAEIQGLLGNLGLAGCASLEIFPETFLNDAVVISGGAGVRFSGGVPPLFIGQLIANIRLFTGCDLRSWSPFGRSLRQAGGGGRTFTVDTKAPVLALELTGTGGAPRVTAKAPDGKIDRRHGTGHRLHPGRRRLRPARRRQQPDRALPARAAGQLDGDARGRVAAARRRPARRRAAAGEGVGEGRGRRSVPDPALLGHEAAGPGRHVRRAVRQGHADDQDDQGRRQGQGALPDLGGRRHQPHRHRPGRPGRAATLERDGRQLLRAVADRRPGAEAADPQARLEGAGDLGQGDLREVLRGRGGDGRRPAPAAAAGQAVRGHRWPLEG